MPRRCLHGVHRRFRIASLPPYGFASALPARGASVASVRQQPRNGLCLGAACTGCIPRRRKWMRRDGGFASALPARGASSRIWGFVKFWLLCLGAACTGCIDQGGLQGADAQKLCLGAACTGCILRRDDVIHLHHFFASALPARGASLP